MSDFLKRATTGMMFVFSAWSLIHMNHEVWALLPAATGVYLLGMTLYDAILRNY